jgi:predicted nucleotidyltransferase
VTHDIKKFFELLLKKSGNILERIYSPLLLHTTPEHAELKAIVPKTLTVHHAHHYFGFSRRKWGEFIDKPPYQVKALLYTYRTLLTGIYLMQKGEIESNLVHLNAVYQLPYIPDLIAAKLAGDEKGYLADADLEFHKRDYERLTELLRTAQAESHLPQHPGGQDELSDLLVRIRLLHLDSRLA